MADQFIETEDGMVNLRHVARIARLRNRTDGHNARVYAPDGSSHLAFVGDDHWDLLGARMLPALPGQQVVLVSIADGDAWVSYPVLIGWAVSQGAMYPTPILDESPASNEQVLIKRPDGAWLWQVNQEFPSLEAAVEHFRTIAKEEKAAADAKGGGTA